MTEEQQNIANWFQYYRSRSLESRASLAQIIINYPEINFGITSLGNRSEKKYFFLNGKNYIADAVLENRGWSTVLIGSMRQGGQGYFALDITNPESFSADSVLWEFTDKDDPDLGLTYSKPAFGAFENNTFYAVLSNGYYATVSHPNDQIASSLGQAALYILNLSSGEMVKKLTTGVGMAQDPTGQGRQNGFAEPALVDVDRNGLIDRIYVGDYFGNMYAFDLSSQNTSEWASAYGSPTAPIPLVKGSTVNNQPITSRPAITKNPKSGHILIIYGTGENITTTSNLQPNYLLAVKDEEPMVTTESLVRRSLVSNGSTWSIDAPPVPQAA